MTALPDARIRDLGQTRLCLRRDLHCTPRIEGRQPYYVLEDRMHSKFYRIGVREYAFLSALDGRRTVQQAIRDAARAVPRDGVSAQQAAAICKWLVDHQLVHAQESEGSTETAHTPGKDAAGRDRERWNPLCVRIPLAHPNRLLDRLVPWIGWFFSPAIVGVRAAGVVAAAAYLFLHWDRFAHSAVQIVAPHRWLYLGLCWLVLKLLHELAHAMVCKRYGAAVREAGVLLILFAPLAYVDVSSGWRLRSKWQRIHIAAAGMAMELTLAAGATAVWAASGAGLLRDLALNVLVMAGLTSVVVNANPLMRFDGYFILADLLEIPNLYGIAWQRLKSLMGRALFGVTAPVAEWCDHGWWLIVYAVAALLWRVLVIASLLIAAALLMPGAEVVVAAAAAWCFGGYPAWTFARYLARGSAWGRPHRLRFVGVVAAAAVGGAALLTAVTWPMPVRAPALIEDRDPAVVRAGSEGFVRLLMVREGARVAKGQLLAVLDNPDLAVALADRRLAVEQARWRCRSYRQEGELAAYQAEKKKLDALRQQTRQLEADVEELTVRAPASGTVVGRSLDAVEGTYLRSGDVLLVISRSAEKEARVSIAEDDLQAFSASIGQSIRLHIVGFGTIRGRLVRVLPRATDDPPDPLLSAVSGGALAVQRRWVRDKPTAAPRVIEELVEPRFSAIVQLDRVPSDQLRAGQRAVAFVASHRETVAAYLARRARKWCEQQMARGRAGT